MYKYILKPIFFRLSAERAHHLTIRLLRFALAIPGMGWLFKKMYRVQHPSLEREVFGLRFANPVGLAAGFDKDGKHYDAMSALGFGFIEIGTVTPLPQDGNPKPRLFRLPADEALINRMGFNNEGVEAMAQRLQKAKKRTLIIGGNIGKNKVTPNEEAVNDYRICFERLFPLVDYFVVNVSSPNTPNLRELQEREPLQALLSELQALNNLKDRPKPILLKIAPDLNTAQLDDIIEIVQESGIAGLIATNTTIERKGLLSQAESEAIGGGGLSGKPLQDRSTEVIRYLASKSKGRIPIIGVGGIDSPESAQAKLDAGAVLVQVYSGMIYQGPGLIRRINRSLLRINRS
ncbi:MAG: quinone-dependent dihydroorotate dehydrogenase [Saprospiraceae bacterium]|nr:quinone-dependent dihydroorotate dehydrogenase [Saprospiraceae bacterium]